MSILSVENLAKQFGSRTILTGVTFRVAYGDRIGLVGANGCGKSTMLKILAGEIIADDGKIGIAAQVTLRYLPQSFDPIVHQTVSDWLNAAQSELLAMQTELALEKTTFIRG